MTYGNNSALYENKSMSYGNNSALYENKSMSYEHKSAPGECQEPTCCIQLAIGYTRARKNENCSGASTWPVYNAYVRALAEQMGDELMQSAAPGEPLMARTL